MAINEVTFNSVNFWQDLGAALSAPISYPVPTEVKELVKIKGANGSLTEATGYYNNIEIDAKFKVLFKRAKRQGCNTFEGMKREINLLFNRITNPKLSFSDMNGKCYKVKTAGIGPVTKISDYEATFEVTFNCDPFLYITSEEAAKANASSIEVSYTGDIPNAPEITIEMETGGQTHLTVNGGSLLSFETITGETYYINKNPFSIVTDKNGKAVKSSGPIPVLSSESNTISIGGFSGSKASSITVCKNERYLG